MKFDIDLTNYYSILNKAYWECFTNRDRIRLIYGSSGSGKSYHLAQEFIYKIIAEEKYNVLVIRKVASTHRTSCFAVFQQVINEQGFSSLFKINKTDLTITCKHNGNEIIFKGMDSSEKIKSVTATNGIITAIFCEEATELTQSDFNQLNIRLRGKSKHKLQITVAFNPISKNHWIYKEFFLKKTYQKRNKVYILKTTYKDNMFLDEDYKAVLESYKDIDEQFYRVYCLAEFGVFGDTIFNNYTLEKCPYSIKDFDAVYAGLDFGYTHPQCLVLVGFKDGVMYSFDELVSFETTNKEFMALNDEFQVLPKELKLTCDSAEPSKIRELVLNGYSAVGAVKGKDSVSRGIDFLQSQKWVVDPDKCPRLTQELEQYSWKKDKNGEKTNNPIDIMDDSIKATMYALEDLSRMKGKPSVLSGTKSDHKKSLIDYKKEERKRMREIRKAQRQKLKKI